MNEAARIRFFQRALLAFWAIGTCALLFVVFFLFNELRADGKQPFARSQADTGNETAAGETETPAAPAESRMVPLYFTHASRSKLEAEERPIPHHDSTVENCREAIEALLSGPGKPGLSAIIPPEGTSLQALYIVEDTELVLDFSRELAQKLPRSVAAEALLLQGLAHTLSQQVLHGSDGANIQRIRILVEGAPAERSEDFHLDFSRSYAPDTDWVLESQGTGSSS